MKIVPVSVVAMAIISTGHAASADDIRCTAVPAAQRMSIETAITKAEALGYAIREAKQSKGCWKVEGYDRNGAKIEIYLHPVSGDVIKPAGWRAPGGT